MTPLHFAVRRGLIRTIVFLIKNGADVNAVAEGDCMPLTLADGLEATTSEKDKIIDVLLKRYLICKIHIPSIVLLSSIILMHIKTFKFSGAKRCWRRDVKCPESSREYEIIDCSAGHPDGNYSTAAFQTSTASCRGGGNLFSTG